MCRHPMLSLAVSNGVFLLLLGSPAADGTQTQTRYPWLSAVDTAATLEVRVPPPTGFVRLSAPPDSFAMWLRGLPMKPAGAPVKLFDGGDKSRQDVHAAVIDIDVGRRDLQQCADAVMRLRAEWLRAVDRSGDIAFDYTGGGRVSYARWAKGERPSSNGRSWSARANPDDSYASFRRYLDRVFIYAGSYSLERELIPVPAAGMDIGDVFVKGAFPGHAVLVADMVAHEATGERRFLLVQSYMPAQDMHVLKNPRDAAGSPWYPVAFAGDLATPEWTFAPTSLRRWPTAGTPPRPPPGRRQ
ncbi:MAG: DUF4846 domain-containing protein [Hyphomicrobiaceae bacterium]